MKRLWKKFSWKFKRNPMFGLMMIGIVPLVLVFAITGAMAQTRPSPLITLCEVGGGVDVALLTTYDGSVSLIRQTDADGNYEFYPAQLQRGQWPLYLPPSNFEPGGRLERYQVVRPDLQYAKVPIGGARALHEYIDILNELGIDGIDEADELILAEAAVLTQSSWPCWEMVRKPSASIAYTDDLRVDDDLLLYGEARWPELSVALTDTLVLTHTLVNAGPWRPAGVTVGDGGQITYREGVSQTVPITIGNGITMTGRIRYQVHSAYQTLTCMKADRALEIQLEQWGRTSCLDEWLSPVEANERVVMDVGQMVVTGTAVIEPAIDTAVWPLQSVTCALTAVSASAMYCTVDDGLTVTVWDSSFAVSETAVQVAWVGLAQKN